MATDEEMEAKIDQWERERMDPSPLPWFTRPHDSYMCEDDEAPIEIVDARGDTVADNARYYPHQIKLADAEFIVRRVNSHDVLVSALEEARKDMARFAADFVDDPDKHPNVLKIDAALAMARKG